MTLTEKSLGPEAPEVAGVLDQYAELLAEMKKPADAKRLRDRADAIRKNDAPPPN